MREFIITIESDMKQQLVFHANSIYEALDKAKIAFKSSMVIADDSNGVQQHRPLSTVPQTIPTKQHKILVNPPTIKPDKEEIKKNLFDSIPD